MRPGELAALIILVVLISGFLAGNVANRRLGEKAFRWLETGLKKLGSQIETRWFGTSSAGGRLVLVKARSPFRTIETRFLLQMRENLPFWLFSRFNGRRDEIILIAALEQAPAQQVIAGRASDARLAVSLRRYARSFKPVATTSGYTVLAETDPESSQVQQVLRFIEKYPGTVSRLSLQPNDPQLVIRADLPALTAEDPEAFFKDLSKALTSRT